MNFLSLKLFGDGNNEEEEQNANNVMNEQANQTNLEGTAAQSLSQEEIRRKRLLKLEKNTNNDTSTTTTTSNNAAPTNNNNNNNKEVVEVKLNNNNNNTNSDTSVTKKVELVSEKQPNNKQKEAILENEAMQYIFKVTLSASIKNNDFIHLPNIAQEYKTNLIHSQIIDSTLYARLAADANDLLPRPTISPLRYLFGCID